MERFGLGVVYFYIVAQLVACTGQQTQADTFVLGGGAFVYSNFIAACIFTFRYDAEELQGLHAQEFLGRLQYEAHTYLAVDGDILSCIDGDDFLVAGHGDTSEGSGKVVGIGIQHVACRMVIVDIFRCDAEQTAGAF